MSAVFSAAELAEATAGRWQDGSAPSCSVRGIATDSRVDVSGQLFVAIRGEHHDGHAYVEQALKNGAACVMIDRASGGPSGSTPALVVDDTIEALGRLASWHRNRLGSATVIGMTGSCGKTTTKHLLDSVLRNAMPGVAAERSFNNSIGVPLTLLRATVDDAYVIVEIGTNAPGEIGSLSAIARPDISVVTCVEPAHLEGFGSIEAIGREKSAIFGPWTRRSFAGSSTIDRMPPDRVPSDVIRFGSDPGDALQVTSMALADGLTTFELADGGSFRMKLAGRHNVMNALAVIGIARSMGVSDSVIAAGLEEAEAPGMRYERQRIGGAGFFVEIVNDAYNANPASMTASLETFLTEDAGDGRRVLVLGEMLELGADGVGYHEALGHTLLEHDARTPLDLVVLVGASLRHTEQVLVNGGFDRSRCVCAPSVDGSHGEAIATSIADGDRVLLKGSRGNALERLLPVLMRVHSAEGTSRDDEV